MGPAGRRPLVPSPLAGIAALECPVEGVRALAIVAASLLHAVPLSRCRRQSWAVHSVAWLGDHRHRLWRAAFLPTASHDLETELHCTIRSEDVLPRPRFPVWFIKLNFVVTGRKLKEGIMVKKGRRYPTSRAFWRGFLCSCSAVLGPRGGLMLGEIW